MQDIGLYVPLRNTDREISDKEAAKGTKRAPNSTKKAKSKKEINQDVEDEIGDDYCGDDYREEGDSSDSEDRSNQKSSNKASRMKTVVPTSK